MLDLVAPAMHSSNLLDVMYEYSTRHSNAHAVEVSFSSAYPGKNRLMIDLSLCFSHGSNVDVVELMEMMTHLSLEDATLLIQSKLIHLIRKSNIEEPLAQSTLLDRLPSISELENSISLLRDKVALYSKYEEIVGLFSCMIKSLAVR